MNLQPKNENKEPENFELVSDVKDATELLMEFHQKWTGFLSMSRTFNSLTPVLCATLTKEEKVYYNSTSDSLLVMGSRFMPEAALHSALLDGDLISCLDFAREKAEFLGIPKLQCMFPPNATEVQGTLLEYGFTLDEYDCIVMERINNLQ